MMPAIVWPWRRPRIGFAFSDQWLVVASDGSPPAFSELPPGLLKPSPLAPNVQSVAELARLTCQLVEDLVGRAGMAVVALPDLAVTTALFAAGSKLKHRELRTAIASRSASPELETRSDFWRGFRHEVLGAAVRNVVVRQYEQIVEATGARLRWVDTCSLARIPGWAQESKSEETMVVHAQLYRAHYSLAVFRSGELIDLRFKLRPPGTFDGVVGEISRLPGLYGAPVGSLTLSGEGASACAERARETFDFGRISTGEEDERGLISGSVRALLRRLT
ncbi:MAG TPA: hypothetical protein VLK65_31525 [Vicinamibacteria bacterium]|nr:hypothetical protein [Vicinamibacteria bacterium]